MKKRLNNFKFGAGDSNLIINSSLFCTASHSCLVVNRKRYFSSGARAAKIYLFFSSGARARGLAFGVRGYRLPPADFEYKTLGAIVVKDRNPKGKFKIIPSAKGIITIFISIQGLLRPEDLTVWFSDKLRSMEEHHAFISHLDEEVYYNISIVARKGKHNITLYYKNKEESFNKEDLSREFKKFYD